MRNIFAKLALLPFFMGVTFAYASDLNVGVSVAGEIRPGVYGRIDVGNAPPPVVYAQPMVIVKQPRPVAPVYLHVPPGHSKKWSKHCHKYNACGQPVYFVKSGEYEPKRHKHHKDDRDDRDQRDHKEKKHKHKHKHHDD